MRRSSEDLMEKTKRGEEEDEEESDDDDGINLEGNLEVMFEEVDDGSWKEGREDKEGEEKDEDKDKGYGEDMRKEDGKDNEEEEKGEKKIEGYVNKEKKRIMRKMKEVINNNVRLIKEMIDKGKKTW